MIIRSTLPVHFVTASGTGFASDVEGDIWRCLTRVPHPVPHPTNYFLLDMARRHGFRFLDSFPIYYERGDLTREDGTDCYHHCYSPELVWPELVLLTQMIKSFNSWKRKSMSSLPEMDSNSGGSRIFQTVGGSANPWIWAKYRLFGFF